MSPRIEQLNVGAPRLLVAKNGETYKSSIGRRPVSEPQRLNLGGFIGDACDYRDHHGENMAVNVFCTEAYEVIEAGAEIVLERPSFGENFMLSGWPEEQACVGDTFSAGTAVVQVSQPREPCGNVVRFTGLPGIVKVMRKTGRTGYYLRVLEAGEVSPGATLELLERGEEAWSIMRLNRAMYEELADAGQVRALQEVPALSANWKRSLLQQHERLAKKAAGSS